MDLEGAIADVVAGLGEGHEFLLAVEPTRPVAMIGRGVGFETRAIAAEQLTDRGVEFLAGEVPQRDVDRAMAEMVVLPQFPLEVVVDLLAMIGVPAEQERRQSQGLGQRRLGAAPERDILAARAVARRDDDRVFGQNSRRPLHVGDAGMRAGALEVQIPRREAELVDLDLVDHAHGFPQLAAREATIEWLHINPRGKRR